MAIRKTRACPGGSAAPSPMVSPGRRGLTGAATAPAHPAQPGSPDPSYRRLRYSRFAARAA
jgi:hypothetical protein